MLKQEVSEPTESYKCSVCYAIFSDVQLFVEHVTHGHNQTKVLADPESLLRCPSCPLSFDRTQYLREHMENIHQSTPTFSIQGSDCFLNFTFIFCDFQLQFWYHLFQLCQSSQEIKSRQFQQCPKHLKQMPPQHLLPWLMDCIVTSARIPLLTSTVWWNIWGAPNANWTVKPVSTGSLMIN